MMNRQSVIERVRSHEEELRARGIARMALFGSMARTDSTTNSDVDLVVELRDSAIFSLIDQASVRSVLEEWLGAPTDLLIWEDLDQPFRDRIAADRVEIFWDLADIGNVLRHIYDRVSPARLWLAVERETPPLEKIVRALLDSAKDR